MVSQSPEPEAHDKSVRQLNVMKASKQTKHKSVVFTFFICITSNARLTRWSINTVYYMASSASRQDERNRALWLVTRAGKMERSCPLGTTRCIPQAKFPKSHIINPLFSQDGWILAEFFFCEFMDLDFVSVRKHAEISSHLDLTLGQGLNINVVLAAMNCPPVWPARPGSGWIGIPEKMGQFKWNEHYFIPCPRISSLESNNTEE